MKIRNAIFLFFFLLLSLTGFAQENSIEKSNQDAVILCKALQKYHYSPRKLDDEFSAIVFDRFIKTIDPRRLYFTEADIKVLTVFKDKIDDELEGKSWSFLSQVSLLYKKRVEESEIIFSDILQKPMNFSVNETLFISDKDTAVFSKNELEKKIRWNKWMKFEVLWYAHSHYAAIKPDSISVADNIMATQKEIQERVLKIEKGLLNKIVHPVEGYDNKMISAFFYIITTIFDPHTTYMTQTEWESFQSELSTEVLSFGIELTESESGEVSVSKLIPGGAAWKSNELHKGDVLTGLRWEGKEFTDLSGFDKEEIEGIMMQTFSGKLEFTVRKLNGSVRKISLTKEKTDEEENIVKSFILKGAKKIGYISLPGFYTDWENTEGKGCANDVATEIIKLKEENIEGLILDIRYNGGGSLSEGLNLAGLFIDEGPLFISQFREGKPVLMKDANRGTVYDGPLIVMINGQSASASELLASTLQDYNRALIVGSTSFGKATGQRIIPLDTSSEALSTSLSGENISAGVLKVTILKLYRITGKSAQLKGVQPDVSITEINEEDYKESSYPFALPSDSVIKKVLYSPLKPLPISDLTEKSKVRQAGNPEIQQLNKLNKNKPLSWRNSKEGIPLSASLFRREYLEKYEWNKHIEKAERKYSGLYKVENHQYDKNLLNLDPYRKALSDQVKENLAKDIYIEESFQIITDLINLPSH
jgi:carboxyl-terminal processing protease